MQELHQMQHNSNNWPINRKTLVELMTFSSCFLEQFKNKDF